jgi:hypothetical protein
MAASSGAKALKGSATGNKTKQQAANGWQAHVRRMSDENDRLSAEQLMRQKLYGNEHAELWPWRRGHKLWRARSTVLKYLEKYRADRKHEQF